MVTGKGAGGPSLQSACVVSGGDILRVLQKEVQAKRSKKTEMLVWG